jgi:uncharacterized membrane protein YeiH
VLTFSVPHFSLLFLLDLGGTFFFAISGAFRAVKYQCDLLGSIVLATAVGIGGGVIRDLILGVHPPSAFLNEYYLAICILAAIVVFFYAPSIAVRWDTVRIADAIGLGVFAAMGASRAVNAGMGIGGTVICGTMTAVGGGVIRDLLTAEIPGILTSGFYASAAILGSLIFAVMHLSGFFSDPVSLSTAIIVTTSMRFIALRWHWELPRLHKLPAEPIELSRSRRDRKK